jgi:DNA excision repair protein ERCC-4
MNPEPLKPLPVLKGLGDLAGAMPSLIWDAREQNPLIFRRLKAKRGTLQSGDYALAGAEQLCTFERKTISDAVQSVSRERERFFRECHRLRGFQFARIVICGYESEITTGRYRSGMAPAAVIASLRTIEIRFGVPIIFAGTPERAAELIEEYAWRFAVELVRQRNNLLRAVREADQPDVGNNPIESLQPTT